ncbi:porin [Halomonas pacifica]|uniref:Porin n=1 Tax=Bisbaumannia pacifica TaxID=77098 RepID=A0A510XCS7_9GAMM|nr:porin [Halomonas pacifica]MBH8581220.1 porin [Halomonas pacifica]MDC8803601.1 porin [Halomonas pacifica]GEK48861.1 phosphoporin PhoE [Halomonas pacifica]
MKKTLLATAIAGAMGLSAASAQAATVYNQDGTKLDIYGNIQLAYYSVDAGNNSVDELADNGSTFGFAAEHVINPGLTGYLKLEFDDFKADEIKTAGRDSGDQAYVGLRGDFGDARLGSYDALIDDWIQDPITNNEFFDVNDSSSQRGVGGINETDKFTYTSPSFGGFQFALGTQYKGEAESENVTDSGNASFFGGARYTVGAFSVAAVYDNLDNYADAYQNNGQFGDQYGLTAQYTIDSLRLAAKVEHFDGDMANTDADLYALSARYGYGVGDVYGAYQRVDDDLEADERDEFVVGATYNLSDAMYTWAEAAWYDNAQDVGDGVAVGVTYLF